MTDPAAHQGEDPRVEDDDLGIVWPDPERIRLGTVYTDEQIAAMEAAMKDAADQIEALVEERRVAAGDIQHLQAQLETLRRENAKLREALVAVDQHFAAEYWTSDDGETQRPGTPDDNECPRAVNALWRRLRAALDPSSTGTR